MDNDTPKRSQAPKTPPAIVLGDGLKAEAQRLYDLGLNVLPMVGKKTSPAIGQWKPYQSKRMELKQLLASLDRPGITGIGIVLGMTSGGLYCRDFDRPGLYEQWAAIYPDLAKTLPTEKTGKDGGYHVYFRWEIPFSTKKHPDGAGETRGSGSLIVVSPSLHESGRRYQWINPLVSLDTVRPVDPDAFTPDDPTYRETESQSHRETDDTDDTDEMDEMDDKEVIASVSPSLCGITLEDAIRETQPGGIGERNKKIFDFARWLKAIPDYAGKSGLELIPVFRRWYNQAMNIIGTQCWDANLADFVNAWNNVKIPHGQGVLRDACERAFHPAAIATVPDIFEQESMRRLYSLCRELQRMQGKQPFYLASSTASDAIGCDRSTANNLIKLLAQMQILIIQKQHTPSRARRMRFIEPQPVAAG